MNQLEKLRKELDGYIGSANMRILEKWLLENEIEDATVGIGESCSFVSGTGHCEKAPVGGLVISFANSQKMKHDFWSQWENDYQKAFTKFVSSKAEKDKKKALGNLYKLTGEE